MFIEREDVEPVVVRLRVAAAVPVRSHLTSGAERSRPGVRAQAAEDLCRCHWRRSRGRSVRSLACHTCC